MIEELVGRVFATRNAAHIAHWRTKSFAQHVALDEFYSGLVEKIDEIVEVYQGAFGLIDAPTIPSVKPDGILQHIADETSWIEENREKIAQEFCAVENLLDDLAGLYSRTYYKLKNLS
jgi:hypothetical protein